MTPPGILTWLDAGVCSQEAAHSLTVMGYQLPLCARDLGLFGAFLLASGVMSWTPWARLQASWWWAAGLLPLLLDGGNSLAANAGLDLYLPSNELRLATGAIAGAALARLLAPKIGPSALLLTPIPVGGVFFAGTYGGLALLGTAGVLAMLTSASLMALDAGLVLPRRLLERIARSNARWLSIGLALPELTVLALLKHGLVAVLS